MSRLPVATLRNIPEGSTNFHYEAEKVDFYLVITDRYVVKTFIGRSIKPSSWISYKTSKEFEAHVDKVLSNVRASIESKKAHLASRKTSANKAKEEIIPGVLIHTSFSYNMTFNNFYKVLSVKGNVVQLKVLENEWVDGDRGWTGNVKAGKETEKIVTGKFTSSGLKIDDLYGKITTAERTYYENHLD